MTTDDKPSIAELKRCAVYPGDPAQQSVLLRADIALVLLEIAAAALAWDAAEAPTPEGDAAYQHFMEVLAKVRP